MCQTERLGVWYTLKGSRFHQVPATILGFFLAALNPKSLKP